MGKDVLVDDKMPGIISMYIQMCIGELHNVLINAMDGVDVMNGGRKWRVGNEKNRFNLVWGQTTKLSRSRLSVRIGG